MKTNQEGELFLLGGRISNGEIKYISKMTFLLGYEELNCGSDEVLDREKDSQEY